MRRLILPFLFSVFANSTCAGDARVEAALDAHILPGFSKFAARSDALQNAINEDCGKGHAGLFLDAFDSWVEVSHLRFGPTEVDDRAFAIAFWPDTKGFTRKALLGLISGNEETLANPASFAHSSIAGRGLYAYEYLMYDADIAKNVSADRLCDVQKAISRDIANNAASIEADWKVFQNELRTPHEGSPYRTEKETLREMFKALSTGLQFLSEARLGRPLGTFDKPRPKRAEAWRSGRSLHNIVLSLNSLDQLANILSKDKPGLTNALSASFEAAKKNASALTEADIMSVTDPATRLRVEILQQSIEQIRLLTASELGPYLGVAAGFNALDGD